MAQQKTEWVLELKDLMSRKLDGVDTDVLKLQKHFKKLVHEIETPDTSGLDKIKQSTGENVAIMGDAQGAALEFFGALASGNAVAASASIRALAGSFVELKVAAMAFIASPIGIAIAALAGIGFATQQWVKFNQAAAEANVQVKGITNAADGELSGLRVRAEALAETFGGDWTEHLKTVTSLQKGFEITSKEAFDTYTLGMVRGGAQNEEFASSIREYPKLFKQGQFSAQEFLSMIENSQAVGVWSDKLPDAIKEFGLSVQEQTLPAKEALENAFGKKFTNEIFTGIRDGSLSTRDALAMVSAEAKVTSLDTQKQAQLTADLFRGAGEDAAGFAEVIKIVDQSLNGETIALSGLEQKLSDVANQNNRLKEAQAEALESDSYKVFATEVSSVWKELQIGFYDFISGITQGINNFLLIARGAVDGFTEAFSSRIASIKAFIKELAVEIAGVVNAFKGAGDIWTAFKEDGFGAAASAAKNWKNNMVKEVTDVKVAMAAPLSNGKGDFLNGFTNSIIANGKKNAATVEAYNAEQALLAGTATPTGGTGVTGGMVKPATPTGALGINGNSSSGRVINMTLDIKNTFNVIEGKAADMNRMADEFIGIVVDRLRDSAIAMN